ncbi:hypothetical protein CsSME_00020073 [Camellia sinensis var. sinensis]
MIACIASCSGVEGEAKFRARLTGMVSGPSMFVGVRSSLCVVSAVTIGGSSVTPAMDVFEYSHRWRQLWRSGGSNPLKGDMLVIAGSTLYAISNVSEPQGLL